jgi:Leucine-rich repeat (LRR) protein
METDVKREACSVKRVTSASRLTLCASRKYSNIPAFQTILLIALPFLLMGCLVGWDRQEEKQLPPDLMNLPLNKWVPLFDDTSLTGWGPVEGIGFGNVLAEDNMIVLEMGNPMTAVSWAGEFPRSNYEIEVEVSRLDGFDFFCGMTFPVGDSYCTLIVGGFGGRVLGLSNIDSMNASENNTTESILFDIERWYHVRLIVTDEAINMWLNNRHAISQEREGHEFTIWPQQEPLRPFGVGAWNARAGLRNFRFRRIREVSVIIQNKGFSQDSLAVRAILDSNGLAQVHVDSVFLRAANGRIDTLGLRGLQLTLLPQEIGQLTALKWLDVGVNNIDRLPPVIDRLQELEELYCSYNLLTGLPHEIGTLKSLKVLFVNNNQLDSLPPEVNGLVELQTLSLASNRLTVLPSQAAAWKNLEVLNLSVNRLTDLPPETGELSALKKLTLNNNQISSLPPEFGQLLSLQELSLVFNELQEFPDEFGNLSSLKRLNLNHNGLTGMPEEICMLKSLENLILWDNKLTSLPAGIKQMSSLLALNLEKNLLSTFPPEIGDLEALTVLDLTANLLTDVHPSIGKLRHLEELYLGMNQLSRLPPETGQLSSLKVLDIYENRIDSLPPEITNLSPTVSLLLDLNRLCAVPESIEAWINTYVPHNWKGSQSCEQVQ